MLSGGIAMITKTKLVKRIFSSLLTAALAVPMTALTAHATGCLLYTSDAADE